MKKFFFFRSSTDKTASPAAFLGDTEEKILSCWSDPSSSPSTSSGSVKAQQHIQSPRFRTPTPEKHAKVKRCPVVPPDRRSNAWSLKVDKYKAEEQRLRERVREIAEQNVTLQREVSSFSEIESERKNLIAFSEKQINDLTSMLESAREENQVLQQRNCELQDKCAMIEDDRARIERSYGEQEEECKELRSYVSGLLKTCGEQEKTIDGLRGEFVELVQKEYSTECFDNHVRKLQMELIRLTGVEQALRREMEFHKQGVDSLRHENVQLLERLKVSGKGGGFLTFKLDEELSSRLLCLEKQGLSLLNESFHISSMLLESIKRMGQNGGRKDGLEGNTSCFDIQFIIESGVKIQGLRRGTESLMRSLQNISVTLHERSDLVTSESQTENVLLNGRNSQMMKKDCEINQLQNNLEESVKELSIMLSKVTKERDMIWEDVKQHNEMNMLLNSEVDALKRKIEILDEDILLKEGQITILKDTISSKSFDLLSTSDQTLQWLLE